MPRPQNLITRAEAAHRAHRHVRTIDRWIRARKLTEYRRGGFTVLLDADELDTIIGRQAS